MEIEEVKIDRCFVRDIHKSAYNYRFLGNMLQLAESSRIRVCCEGIETTEELAALEELRPRLLQGFLFSRPISAVDFTARYLEQDSPSYQARLEQENSFRRLLHNYDQVPLTELAPGRSGPGGPWTRRKTFFTSAIRRRMSSLYQPRQVSGSLVHGITAASDATRFCRGETVPVPLCQGQLDTDRFLMRDHMNEYCGRRLFCATS